MHRRLFHRAALGSVVASLAGCAAPAGPAAQDAPPAWPALEADALGRLGVAVLDAQTGSLIGHRLDERFPMCSTFKWLAAAHVLHRVDQGHEQLSRRIRYGREALLPWSPVTEQHVDGPGLSLAELCHATITTSDNAAGNLILQTLGGPAGLTAFARQLGDAVTRLDRWEPALNEAAPGDPRDTTSPRAMAQLLHTLVLGPALSPASRAQLAQWLQATRTNVRRLGDGLPPGWRLGSKTGSGAHGTTNDVGVYWPEGRPPIVAVALLTASTAAAPQREAALAGVAAVVRSRARA